MHDSSCIDCAHLLLKASADSTAIGVINAACKQQFSHDVCSALALTAEAPCMLGLFESCQQQVRICMQSNGMITGPHNMQLFETNKCCTQGIQGAQLDVLHMRCRCVAAAGSRTKVYHAEGECSPVGALLMLALTSGTNCGLSAARRCPISKQLV